jgi:DNA-binding transcriptional ArsR family regulator
MTDIFDSLADSTRRDIVSLLRSAENPHREMSVGELVESLGITQPTVSKHLKVLREVGIVVVREEGQHRYYRLDPAPLAAVGAWAAGDAASAPATGSPFLDLEFAGKATGSLVRDLLGYWGQLSNKFFR